MTSTNGGSIYSQLPQPENIDFTEAIKDSPRFRASIAQHVVYFSRLENRLNEALSDAFGHTLTLSKAYHEQSSIIIYNKLNNFIKRLDYL
ncbi:hypothetical protein WR25_14571 [Diploscapter pachys]|uniref:Uncharacterized protein n=1 Tax=Diploscapter pachys TaxID=2018661 RepID=A0A2A2LQQ9_9BILA|nr:hypothetical protein WR25_14571 [Diploscapter pachys]